MATKAVPRLLATAEPRALPWAADDLTGVAEPHPAHVAGQVDGREVSAEVAQATIALVAQLPAPAHERHRGNRLLHRSHGATARPIRADHPEP